MCEAAGRDSVIQPESSLAGLDPSFIFSFTVSVCTKQ